MPLSHNNPPGGSGFSLFGCFSPALRLLLLICVVAIPVAGPSQLSSSLGKSGSSEVQEIEPEEAVRTALESFDETSRALIEKMLEQNDLPNPPTDEKLEEIRGRIRAKFAKDLKEKVSELRGDGFLSVEEVTTQFGGLSDDAETRLQEEVGALIEGAEPPPNMDDGDVPRYLGRLASYAVFERNALFNWLALLAFIGAGIIGAALLTRTLRIAAAKLEAMNSKTAAEFVSTLRKPLYFLAALIGITAGLNWVWLPVEITEFVSDVFLILYLVSLLWLVWNLCGIADFFVDYAARSEETEVNGHIAEVIQKGMRLFATILFLLFASDILFSADFKGLIAGVGVLGLALTLAAHDTFKNFFGSLTVYGDSPYQAGDILIHEEQWATVERIGFRSTKLRTWDGYLITVPNSDIVSSSIVNVSARPYIRRRTRLDIPYDTPPEKVRKAIDLLNDILANADGRPEDPEHHVAFDEFGPHSLRILIQYYYAPPEYWEAKENDTKVNLAIMEAFAEHGIEFAFPTQRVYLDTEKEHIPQIEWRGGKPGKQSDPEEQDDTPEANEAEAEEGDSPER